MKCVVVIFHNQEHQSLSGACFIDKKFVTMYCIRDAVRKWLIEHLNATNIEFEWGTQKVSYTFGGGAPMNGVSYYRSTDYVVDLEEEEA